MYKVLFKTLLAGSCWIAIALGSQTHATDHELEDENNYPNTTAIHTMQNVMECEEFGSIARYHKPVIEGSQPTEPQPYLRYSETCIHGNIIRRAGIIWLIAMINTMDTVAAGTIRTGHQQQQTTQPEQQPAQQPTPYPYSAGAMHIYDF